MKNVSRSCWTLHQPNFIVLGAKKLPIKRGKGGFSQKQNCNETVSKYCDRVPPDI